MALYDANGKAVNPKNLPKDRKAREAVLATLREVPTQTRRGHAKDFNLGTIARFKDTK